MYILPVVCRTTLYCLSMLIPVDMKAYEKIEEAVSVALLRDNFAEKGALFRITG